MDLAGNLERTGVRIYELLTIEVTHSQQLRENRPKEPWSHETLEGQ